MTTPLSWVGVSLLTGQIIADLPGIELTGPLATTIGQAESTTVTLNLASTTNPDWPAATLPGGVALIAYTGEPSAPTIVYGGIVTQRVRDTSYAVTLSLSTAETYLGACYIGDYTATSKNQDAIIADLMSFANGASQIPFVLQHLPNASTFLQTVAYAAADQVTVLSALQSLSAISGGPEWTIYWSWDLTAATITPTFAYGARIGTPAAGVPNVTVELADLLSGSTFTEDYSTGYGANSVTAVGAPPPDAANSSVPSVNATAANLNGRPLWAYSYQPDSTVSDLGILSDYVQQALTQMSNGIQPLQLILPNDLPGKRFGVDWFLGDDIGWVFEGLAFPGGVSGLARCIGYQVDHTTITPVLKGAGLS